MPKSEERMDTVTSPPPPPPPAAPYHLPNALPAHSAGGHSWGQGSALGDEHEQPRGKICDFCNLDFICEI